MSRFINSRYKAMEPYTPGDQPQGRTYIKLNTNESPYPPSPKVLEAVDRAQVEQLRLYSDPEAKILVDAIAEYYGLDKNQVVVSNGSDEILASVTWPLEKVVSVIRKSVTDSIPYSAKSLVSMEKPFLWKRILASIFPSILTQERPF